MTWRTGGHGSSKTFAKINARYKRAFILTQVESELNSIKALLNQRNIPTDLPPMEEIAKEEEPQKPATR